MNPRTALLMAALTALTLATTGSRTCVPVQPTEPAARFTAASASFGECWGPCRSELTVDGSDLTLLVRGWDGVVFLDLSGELAPRLTAAGAEQADALAAALLGVTLQPVYGCPDCADGGACSVSLVRDGVASTHTYDCSTGPPPVLAAADEFWQGIIDDLANCRDSPYAFVPADWDCVPVHAARCVHGGQAWLPGQSFPAGDGCNTCLCTPDGEVECTLVDCTPDAEFRAASAHYGFCGGPCLSDLTIDGGALRLLVTGHDGEVYVDWSGPLTPYLTAEGRARAAELADALLGVELRPVYGCPDCADGGACSLTLRRNGVESTHTYDCSSGPPAVLAPAHEFWQGIIDDLENCEPSPWYVIDADIDCLPLRP